MQAAKRPSLEGDHDRGIGGLAMEEAMEESEELALEEAPRARTRRESGRRADARQNFQANAIQKPPAGEKVRFGR